VRLSPYPSPSWARTSPAWPSKKPEAPRHFTRGIIIPLRQQRPGLRGERHRVRGARRRRRKLTKATTSPFTIRGHASIALWPRGSVPPNEGSRTPWIILRTRSRPAPEQVAAVLWCSGPAPGAARTRGVHAWREKSIDHRAIEATDSHKATKTGTSPITTAFLASMRCHCRVGFLS
jgi:hypothetical protein